MTHADLISLGFEEISHFTIGRVSIYKLGLDIHLSVGSVGTPNEMMFICETDEKNEKEITDLICLHNYDYNGFLTKEKLESLIKLLN